MTKMNNMEELIKQLENTRNFVFYCPDDRDAIEKAIEYLKQYAEIQKIVAEFNVTRDSSPMVERTYAEYTKIEKVECFDKILNLFKE